MAALKKSEASINNKKDISDKIKEKRAKIDAIFKGSDEPIINPLDYKSTLIQALNWYNIYASPADKKKWALDTITNKLRKSLLSKLDEHSFRILGTLSRIQSRDQFLEENELVFIKDTLERLDALSIIPKEKVEDTKPKNVISIQDKVKSIAINFASEIDGEIDDFIRLGYPKTYVFKNSIKSISGQAAKLIPDMYKDQIAELEEVLVGECEQLNDSYSHIKTVQVKNFLKLMKDFVASCTQQVVSSKKVRVSKPKAPTVIVSKLKYLPVFPELGIKSITPTKLVDSQEVWLYDTVKRKLTYYKAVVGDTLSVKGTAIIGYDVNVSSVKTIRKPEVVKDLSELNKKQILEQFNRMASKGSVPNGRTNENMIILRVF
jgi:hypothetical protein